MKPHRVVVTAISTLSGLLCALGWGLAQAQVVKAPQLAPLVQPDGELSPVWRFVGFPKKQADLPPTRFEAGNVDQQAALKVTTESSYGTWVHPWRGSVPSQLQWRWRLDEPLSGGKGSADLLAKSGDDAALKVCVMFDLPLDSIPFVDRTVLRIARSVSGEPLPAATLCYVWDSAGPALRQGVNPYTRRVRFISLQGRSAPLSRWVSESRDVGQDFATLFADELPKGTETPRSDLPPVTQVVIGADSDNTASHSTAWIRGLRWVP
ncbi:DUF3047 domain-containing protein [Hydrogenophaga sp. PAMC20947]|uniref:DUF3047 domain-containing protein n=1 Tax=Hydrogenophaga sp. PAMC20947 TaxID=2565558 RepID=UPI00109E287C|nr:DUF3047 domain-containing protein [Hydrogenophaga sp. PAMC20947]QCB46591.1 DUF3047 domain-containing protein [Hydrogenophaga sp. PAMC20947]